MEHLPTIIWFKHCTDFPLSQIGEKGVNLGKLELEGLPIPPGFVIPSGVFAHLLTPSKEHLEHIFAQVDSTNPQQLGHVSQQIHQLIQHIHIEDEIAQAIIEGYENLGNNAFVAIRSSKSDSQLPDIHDTYFNIQGDANVLEYVKRVWAQLYQPKMLLYLFEHLRSPADIAQAIVVQRMTESKVAGLAYSRNPDNQNKRTVVIDAVWGLGDHLRNHPQDADRYEVEKDTLQVIQQQRHAQDTELIRRLGKTHETPIPDSRKFSPKLSSQELKQLATLAVHIQQKLFYPQQVEWALEAGKFYLLQTQPLMEKVVDPHHSLTAQTGTMRPILFGSSAHPGLISGKVKLCPTPAQYTSVLNGEICVTHKLNTHHLEALRKAAAIIVDEAVFPRDVQHLGIPCIGNTHFGTHTLKNGQQITVYGQQGIVYEGTLRFSQESGDALHEVKPYTTRLYLALNHPDELSTIEQQLYAGVGLLRAEQIVEQIGLHPKFAIHQQKEQFFVHQLAQQIQTVCKAVHPKPVYYRFLNMTSDVLKKLHGGAEYEPTERNPELGYRGAFRNLTDTASFDLELEALRQLKQSGFDNLHVILPFARSVEEFVLLKSHLEKKGLQQSSHFQIWLSVDTPAAALTLEGFLSHGVDGVMIAAEDLHMLLFALDAKSATELSVSYHKAPAMKAIIKTIIAAAKKYQKPLLFGEYQLDSELVELLVHQQVEGICVTPKQIPYMTKLLKES